MLATPNLSFIEKESIKDLAFGNTDVLRDKQLVKQRKRKLKRAEQLGNAYKTKAKILFRSLEGIFKVETTVWAATENYVSLKGGVLIPIHCIKGVDFY
jgi:hypothetical protein